MSTQNLAYTSLILFDHRQRCVSQNLRGDNSHQRTLGPMADLRGGKLLPRGPEF